MKGHILTLWTFFTMLSCLTGCKDEIPFVDVDGLNPSIELLADHIRSEYGKEFVLTGKIVDNDGIKSIRLISTELELDKNIDLLAIYAETVYEYELSYKLSLPRKSDLKEFYVKIVVTDLGGRITEHSVRITSDGDSTAPIISNMSPSEKIVNIQLFEDGTSHSLSFKATDDKGLDYVSIVIPEMDVNDIIKAGEGVKELNVSKTYNLEYVDKEYNITITAIDLLGNTQSYSYKMVASTEPDYEQIYLIDFIDNNDAKLYIFGSHIIMKRIAPYTYTTTYFSSDNSNLRFTVSDTDFSICYGQNRDTQNTLTDNVDNLQPVNISAKGYYDITINIKDLSYSIVSHINSSIYKESDLYVYGAGLDGVGANPSTTTKQLQINDEAFYSIRSCEIEQKSTNRFYMGVTGKGWDPYWRLTQNGFGKRNDSSAVNSWNDIQPGTYYFYFDTYLGYGYMKLKKE